MLLDHLKTASNWELRGKIEEEMSRSFISYHKMSVKVQFCYTSVIAINIWWDSFKLIYCPQINLFAYWILYDEIPVKEFLKTLIRRLNGMRKFSVQLAWHIFKTSVIFLKSKHRYLLYNSYIYKHPENIMKPYVPKSFESQYLRCSQDELAVLV